MYGNNIFYRVGISYRKVLWFIKKYFTNNKEIGYILHLNVNTNSKKSHFYT